MAAAIRSSTVFFLLAITTFSSAFSTAAAGGDASRAAATETFARCLSKHSAGANLGHLLYSENATSTSPYSSILSSTIDNLRFTTPSTPKPASIITPSSAAEVSAAVVCCQRHGYQIRARSGGHDYEGLSSRSVTNTTAFVIVDLSLLRRMSVDADKGTAWVQSGATLGELYYHVAEGTGGSRGFPAGYCPAVGVGGHFSGGGIGTMARRYGVAADHVIDATVVVADGRVLDRRSMGEDLFWAIRGGGGGNFGIAVDWKVNLVAVPVTVSVFTVTKNSQQEALPLLTKWQLVAPKLHRDIFLQAFINTNPNASIGGGAQATFRALNLGGCGDLLDAVAKELPELATEAKEGCKEMSWADSAAYFAGYGAGLPTKDVLLDPKLLPRGSFKAKTDFVREPLPAAAWKMMWEEVARGGQAFVFADPYGGRLEEILETEIPFPHRKGILFNLLYIVGWDGSVAGAGEEALGWIGGLYRAMEPYVSGSPREAYVNFRDLDLGSNVFGSGAAASFSEGEEWGRKYFMENFWRLAAIKGIVDPNDFFWNEQSIPVLPKID